MFKKIYYTIIILLLVMSNNYIVLADDENEEITQEEYIEAINQAKDEPKLNSRIAVAYDRRSGEII